MSDQDIDDISGWLTRLKTAAPRIEHAGVVAGANAAAQAGVRAYAGSDSLSVPVGGALRAAPRIKAAIEAGMDAEFKQVSA